MKQTPEKPLSSSDLLARGIHNPKERVEVASRVASFAEELDSQGFLSQNWWSDMLANRSGKDGTDDEILLSALSYLNWEDSQASTVILRDLSSS